MCHDDTTSPLEGVAVALDLVLSIQVPSTDSTKVDSSVLVDRSSSLPTFHFETKKPAPGLSMLPSSMPCSNLELR